MDHIFPTFLQDIPKPPVKSIIKCYVILTSSETKAIFEVRCLSSFTTFHTWRSIPAILGWITSSWWLNQPLWKISVKLEIFPNFRGENKKYLKPEPSWITLFAPFFLPHLSHHPWCHVGRPTLQQQWELWNDTIQHHHGWFQTMAAQQGQDEVEVCKGTWDLRRKTRWLEKSEPKNTLLGTITYPLTVRDFLSRWFSELHQVGYVNFQEGYIPQMGGIFNADVSW